MCIRDVSSFLMHAGQAASRLSGNASRLATSSVERRSAPSPGAAVGVVDDPVVDSGIEAFKALKNVFTDDANWGEAVRIDRGRQPRHFGYGEPKTTIGELHTGPRWTTPGMIHEVAVKLRSFGHSDPCGTASIGAEAEVGPHTTTSPTRVLGHDFGAADAFLGFRGRAVAEAGFLGVRAGEELFLGASLQGGMGDMMVETPEAWWHGAYSIDLGVAQSGIAEIDVLGGEIYGGMRAGLDARVRARRHQPIYEGLGIVGKSAGNLLVGALAQGEASAGLTGVSLDAEAFAGAKLGLQQGFAAAYEGSEVIGGFVGADVWVGAGAKVDAELGYDEELERVRIEGEAGAALGLGGSATVGVSFGQKEIGKVFDVFGGD